MLPSEHTELGLDVQEDQLDLQGLLDLFPLEDQPDPEVREILERLWPLLSQLDHASLGIPHGPYHPLIQAALAYRRDHDHPEVLPGLVGLSGLADQGLT